MTQPFLPLSGKVKKILWGLLAFMLAARVAASVCIPLCDSTEARYGEIARRMLASGDWITPQDKYSDVLNHAFWAKPPLAFWMSALSMKCFGVNEFAARLPSLLLGIGMLALVWHWVKRRFGGDCALLAVVVLASMAQFFVVGGTMMTDSGLAFCTTLTMVAFWQAMHETRANVARAWGYLFFAGLGFGLLAKGPLVGVLTWLPIVPWLFWRRQWAQVWRRLPWLTGILLMLAIGAPWYVLAERKTPGFLRYFIVGEHFGRALYPGWKGDKYGFAHSAPLGTIWLFWILAAAPWSLALFVKLSMHFKNWRQWFPADEGFTAYLLLWGLAPLVFFSIVHNIIWPYALPALPALAVFIVLVWRRMGADCPRMWQVAAVAAIVPAGMLAAGWVVVVRPAGLDRLLVRMHRPSVTALLARKTQKGPARFYLADRPSADSGFYYFDTNLHYRRDRHFSAEFYSGGEAQVIGNLDELAPLLEDGKTDYLAVEPAEFRKWPAGIQARFTEVKDFDFVKLFRKKP